MQPRRSWETYAERRRGQMVLGALAAGMGSLALWLRSPGGGSMAVLLVVAVGVVATVYAVIAVLVRPRATSAGTAYVVLVPCGSLGRYGLKVTNPDATVPGRLVVSAAEITVTVRGGVRLRFPREHVESTEVRCAPSLRPLGYLTVRLAGGGTLVGRLFQPGPVERALRAAGYPGAGTSQPGRAPGADRVPDGPAS
jgi:hypothetical protein